jgi:pimeloyl-ACP methyl ester carboxylesterase
MPQTADAPHIHFQTAGDDAADPLVLIEGLGAQLICWREAFVERLVARGFRVILVDNRDVGLSDKLAAEDELEACYTLSDMAGDVFRVLDALGLASAHIVGQSMGGAIAQAMATNQPERVRSLSLFYTAPGFGPDFVSDEIREILTSPPPMATLSQQQKVEEVVWRARLASSTNTPFDEVHHTRLAERVLDRCDRPDGVIRQAAALMVAGDWREALEALKMPVAIFHGRADRLVKVAAAFELARRLPTSELHVYPGMGHEVAPPLLDDFADIIARTARRSAAADPRG